MSDVELINSLINQAFRIDKNTFYKSNYSAPVDISRTSDGNYIIAVDAAGLDIKTVDITVENNTLVIKGTKQRPFNDGNGAYFRSEIVCGKFVRSFSLPNDCDPKAIDATYEFGYLKVKIPKAPDKKPLTVQVKAVGV